ncbi:MAG: bifunctional N-acetylglucosamine-1-phosphate uridyltransferase/glucosamine-1-phosphate acetyltransferase [Planctomycetaceae bacterium]
MDAPVAIVLAAGKSTRMKSELPKVLHDVCGRPLIEWVLDAARGAGVKKLIVVVGHKADLVRDALSGADDITFALQEEQKGTGHAVMVCRDQLEDHNGPVMILAGDTPLLQGESLKTLVDAQQAGAACVVGTADTEANFGLGRIVRDGEGNFVKIVEQKDATPDEAAVTEINTGCFVFDNQLLLKALEHIQPNNAQAEYYLTDCPAILLQEGFPVQASCTLNIHEAKGVNTRVELAAVQRTIQQRIQHGLMLSGVSIISPENTWIECHAKIGRDSTIRPFSLIAGQAVIGENCDIGPHAQINGSTVPDGTTVRGFEQFQ